MTKFDPRFYTRIVDQTGKVVGFVSNRTTEVGAARAAKGPVEFSRQFGFKAWVVTACELPAKTTGA